MFQFISSSENTLSHLNDNNKKAKEREIMPLLHDQGHHRGIFPTYLNLPLLTRWCTGQYRSPANSINIFAAPSVLRRVSSSVRLNLILNY